MLETSLPPVFMESILDSLNSPSVMALLFVAAVLLIAIDYIFATDWSCQVGYVCFSLGMFLALPMTPLPSLLAALAIWTMLVILHVLFFRTILENVDDELQTKDS